MANLYHRADGRFQNCKRNPIHVAYFTDAGPQVGIIADYDALGGVIQFDSVQRPSRRNSQSFALSYGVIVDAAMAAKYFPARCNQLAFGLRQRSTALTEIRRNELDIIS